MSSNDYLEFRSATKEDLEALRASARNARAMNTEEYFRFLAQFTASVEDLRRRPLPLNSKPFRL